MEIVLLRQECLSNLAKVPGAYRLREPTSTDADRMAIAEENLADPDYGFGEHGSIVLTTANTVNRKTAISREFINDADVSLSGAIALSGTRETWT